MARLLRTQQTGTDTVAGPTQRWRVGNALAVGLKQPKVSVGLLSVPGPHRVVGDVVEVGLRAPRELNLGHGLARHCGKTGALPDAIENTVLGDATGVTLVDRRPQRFHLLPFALRAPFQRAHTSAQNVLHARRAARRHLRLCKAHDIVREVNLAHGAQALEAD